MLALTPWAECSRNRKYVPPLTDHTLAERLAQAKALAAEGRPDEAVIVLADGARHHAGNPELAAALGQLLSELGRHEAALQVFAAGLRARPGHLELRGLLAAELAADLRTDEALAHLRTLLVLHPGQALIHANIGVLLQTAGRPREALRHYRRAVALDPGNPVARVNLGTALMTLGDYREGFAEYEHRLALPGVRQPPAALPRWQGERPVRSVLVTTEQGFGDMLQFVRFLPLLTGRAENVWLECPAEMKRLFQGLAGLAGVVAPGDAVPPVKAAVPLLSLPHLLGGAEPDLRADSIPYISVPGEGPALPPDRRPRIGLAWSGRQAGSGDLFIRRTLQRRHCRIEDLEPLWSLEDFRWFGLQLGQAMPGPVTDLSPLMRDFADSAVLVSQLDLMISIDSAPAHLAGALGVPLWVMLGPGQADYRWGGADGASPWYPKARLFRAGAGGWPALAADMAAALRVTA